VTRCITVFGGTGFIGRHLVSLLLQGGATVRVAARRPGDVRIGTQSANAPEIIQADLLDEGNVGREAAISGPAKLISFPGLIVLLRETSTPGRPIRHRLVAPRPDDRRRGDVPQVGCVSSIALYCSLSEDTARIDQESHRIGDIVWPPRPPYACYVLITAQQ
jgi:NAD(P)-dependent dehydrogenase (short-subunit alcohol dehydrogenase family)